MSLLDNLPHKCTIRKRIRTKGGLGGSKDSYLNTQTSVACWAQVASHTDTVEFEKKGMVVNRKVYFTSDPGIDEQYQIVITEMNGTAVATASQIPLEVRTEARPDASAGKGLLWKLFAEERTGRKETV